MKLNIFNLRSNDMKLENHNNLPDKNTKFELSHINLFNFFYPTYALY